jgi:ARG and Rhodanese-Phosphatase-superfamily-associated Protein domain
MQLFKLAGNSLAVFLLIAGAARITYAAQETAPVRLSAPVVHDNLAVYFVHGASKPGPVPLTLAEALNKGVVRVSETGNVNALAIENLGGEEIFVQAGDIVKGGRQDRTLMVSLLLPPKSGRIPVASFCVEHGRWSPRKGEDSRTFATSADTVPSKELKLAMQAPLPSAAGQPATETSIRQRMVWDKVKAAQDRLSIATGTNVRAPASASSLQLALENEKLGDARKAYVAALKSAGETGDDIIGFVFAINGKLNSAELYFSNGLFRKMWPKLLDASAIEAISHRQDVKDEAPSPKAATAFIAGGNGGTMSEKPLNFGVRRVMHDSDKAYLVETVRSDGWVHRSYLSK